MLKVSDISFSMAGRPLFDGASATIPNGHKVGIVGRNGTGKTTLFKLIRGELTLDGGSTSVPRGARIGGVAQEVPASQTSLLDTVLAADVERASLLEEAQTATDPGRISDIQSRLADIDAWSAEGRASAILKGLGFPPEQQHLPCADFSGGWRMRVALAGVLFSQPDLLLLDEPTNYLDLEGALWLETYLARYPHTVLIISHDRGLLNRAVQGILHLENKQLTYYAGTYDDFAKARMEKRLLQMTAAKKQDARREHLQAFVDRFKAKASKAKQAQSRVKMLEKMTPITVPEEAQTMVFSFPTPDQLSPPILRLEEAATGYEETVILSKLDLRIDQDDRIALLGRNGEGKSTLSKLLANELVVMNGQRTASSKLRIGYFAQHQMDALHADETPLEHLARLRPDSSPARLRAQLAGFGLSVDQADVICGKLSGGQKARLALLLATLDAPHLLILDEPTNHLDIESREALVEALTAYSGAVVLVSHDMHLLSLVVDRLWLVQGGRVRPYEHDLETYRAELLSDATGGGKGGGKKERAKAKPKVQRASRDQILELRAEVRKCEARVEKITEMSKKLQDKLSDRALYEPERANDLALWNKKYGEVRMGLEKAESLWEQALIRLEEAEK